MKAFLIKCVDGGHGWGETGAFAIVWANDLSGARHVMPGGWISIHSVDVPQTTKFLLNLSPSEMDAAVLTLAREQNASNSKEMALPVKLEDIEQAVYQATKAKFGATNGFPTFTEERVGFAVQTAIDYMMHHLDKVPDVPVSRPDDKLPDHSWVPLAIKAYFKEQEDDENMVDAINCDGLRKGLINPLIKYLQKHQPLAPMPADYDDTPKGGGGE